MAADGRRIGLALGGGGARGLAHLGVYQRLVELGVPICCVAGTSIGAIAGAIIAAGMLDRALAWCAEPDWKKFPKLMFDTRLTSKALTTGRQVEKLLSELIVAERFSELAIPFAAVATDLNTGEKVVMREGGLISAVRASMSIPGVFLPVEREGRVLVDGQLVDPVPVAVCREMGAEAVIAVDINPPTSPKDAKPLSRFSLVDIMIGTLTVLNSELTRRELSEHAPDVLIRPDVGGVLALDFRRAMRLVEIGRQAVDAALAKMQPPLRHIFGTPFP